jgi:hypothetical protein
MHYKGDYRMISHLLLLLIIVQVNEQFGRQEQATGPADKYPAAIMAAGGKIDKEGYQVVLVMLQIAPGCICFANPVENDDLENAKTTLSVKAVIKLRSLKVLYPIGSIHDTGMFTVRIYGGVVIIKAVVQRARGDLGPLEINVKVHPINLKRGTSYPTEVLKIAVD